MSSFRATLWSLAHEQYGYFTRAQALRAGLTPKQLSALNASGDITPVVRGVYRAAAAPEHPHEREYATWLGLIPARTLDERHQNPADDFVAVADTAAHIHHLAGLEPPTIEFAHPSRRQTRDNTIRFHQEAIPATHIEYVKGLPTLTPAATIAWLAAHNSEQGVIAAAIDDARSTNQASLRQIIEALPGGHATYNEIMSSHASAATARVAESLRELPNMSDRILSEFRTTIRVPDLSISPELRNQFKQLDNALAHFPTPKLSRTDTERIQAAARRALETLQTNRGA